MLTILLSILSVIRRLICCNNLNWLLNLNLIYEALWPRVKNGLLISMLGKLSWFCLTCLIKMVLLMWKWMGLFCRKNNLLICWDWPSLLNWIGLTFSLNVASLSIFYRYYFGRCSSELAQLVPLPFSRGRSTRCSDRLHDFCVTIPRCYKDVYVNSFFLRTARLWNSLPIVLSFEL